LPTTITSASTSWATPPSAACRLVAARPEWRRDRLELRGARVDRLAGVAGTDVGEVGRRHDGAPAAEYEVQLGAELAGQRGRVVDRDRRTIRSVRPHHDAFVHEAPSTPGRRPAVATVRNPVGEGKPRGVDRGPGARRRLQGIGHAVYRSADPRLDLLREHGAAVAPERHRVALAAEEAGKRLLAGRRLVPNLDLFAAVVLEGCGIPHAAFTATFAFARIVGWCAHAIEQAADQRILRPAARYVGPLPRDEVY
jgi:hypothetical protein